MMRRNARRRAAGYTLVEMIVVSAVMSVVLLAVVTFSMSTQASYDIVLRGATSTADVRRPLDRMASELRSSAPGQVALDASDPHRDRIVFRVPVGWSGGIVWGAEDEAGFSIEYRVTNDGRLLRRILNAEDGPISEETLARDIDLLRAGVKGFDATINGDHCALTIRVRKDYHESRRIERQASTTVVFRNP